MRRQLVLWGTLASLLLLCERGLTSCLPTMPCPGRAAGSREWLATGLGAAALLAAGMGLGAAVRTAWLAVAGARELRRLPAGECPAGLAALAHVLGVRRLRFLAVDAPLAFCSGAVHPAVYLSRGSCARLDRAQLQAVLLHELDHAVRREPLRRAATRAACEVAFFLPVLGWLHERGVERSELRADRRAIDRLGPRPVAGALWALDAEPPPLGFPAFGSAAQLRAAQLLGDAVPRRLPPPSMLAASFTGALFAVAVVACATEIVVFALH